MTHNDPNTPDTPGTPDQGPYGPYGQQGTYGEQYPYGAQAPSPWSAQGQQASQAQPYPDAGQQQYAEAPQQPGGYQYGPAQYTAPSFPTPPPVAPPKRQSGGAGKLVAGVAVLALLAGGTAGGIGGYLASDSVAGAPATNSLEQDRPAKQTSAPEPGSVEAVADKVLPSVVQLQVDTPRGQGVGSGFVISSDGYIMTNNHVVEGAAGGQGAIEVVFQDGSKATASVVGRDPTTDIAVVKVEGKNNLTPVDLGRSDDLQVGQEVVAIGSPFELSGTVTTGIVSALHRPVSAGGGQGELATVMDAIQTDAAINRGNSGGPLVNMQGQVIGINSAIYSPGGGQSSQGGGGNVGIGFAIPIDQARRTADKIIQTGQATQTYVGATVSPAEGGALVREIVPGSPAEQAGLKPGDVITKINDRVVDGPDTLVAAIRTKAPGTKVTLTLQGGRTVDATLGGKPVPVN